MYRGQDKRYVLAFYRGDDPTTVPIKTRLGTLHFYLGQRVEAIEEQNRYRLETHEYWYRLQQAPGLKERALIRWEYTKEVPKDKATHCRNHVQIATSLTVATDADMDLNRLHLPTGWVTIEEVLRFLVFELELRPRCGVAWPQRLVYYERAFYEEFTSKRYKP